jgi:glycerol kinase
MQLQADLLGVPVLVSAHAEATVTGAAWFAARAAGLWSHDDEIHRRVATARAYEPRIGEDQRAARVERFARAVALVRRHR